MTLSSDVVSLPRVLRCQTAFRSVTVALEESHGSVFALRWIPVVAVSINVRKYGMMLLDRIARGGLYGPRMIQSWTLKAVFVTHKVQNAAEAAV